MGRPALKYQFRLAERLGMTVTELRGRMSLRELHMWMAYDHVVADDREHAKAMGR